LVYLAAAAAICWRPSQWLLERLAALAGGVIFTYPTEAFSVRLKMAFFAGFMVALPLILHQVWLFVARALEPRLRRLAVRLAAASYVLFIMGAGLALLVVVPAAMRFLLAFGGEQIRPLMTLGGYLGFITSLALAFGAVFQLPIALVLLNRLGVVSRLALRQRWRYIYVAAFVFAAVLTPGPDVFSQLALSVPTILIFELTLLTLD
jgi:sec-independent protein translocase protein TatC